MRHNYVFKIKKKYIYIYTILYILLIFIIIKKVHTQIIQKKIISLS